MQAMEFPTEDALKKYLKDHPDADKGKHKVKKTEKSKSKKDDTGSDEFDDAAPDYKTPIRGGAGGPNRGLPKHKDIALPGPKRKKHLKQYAFSNDLETIEKMHDEVSAGLSKMRGKSMEDAEYAVVKKQMEFIDDVYKEKKKSEGKKEASLRVAARFIQAQIPDAWLTRDDVREVCPACADKMASLNIREIRASALFGQDLVKLAGLKEADKWKSLPKGWTEDSLKSFWSSIGGKGAHKITACMKKMSDKMDDPGAFCGGLASRLGER
jgi:hypothetical protein